MLYALYCYLCCNIDYIMALMMMPVLSPEALWDASQNSALPLYWLNNGALTSNMP